MGSSGNASFDAFKATFAVVSELPYCDGAVPLDSTPSTLFYKSGENAASLDFASVTDVQLEVLAKACQPASFGIAKEDVLDVSYRKAGKLDSSDFATQFSPRSTGILNTIATTLLQGRFEPDHIKMELYKLNVYGPGSFFKAHVDTPRGETMFGSLVVVFPTAHEGGSLIFRHGGQEWSFDSAKVVSSTPPQIAFAAFYSDIEHEVLPVTSGYRVTLTYNLHVAATPNIPASVLVPKEYPGLSSMKASLSALLEDPTFLPDGGLLGFGLSYRYPFKYGSTSLPRLARHLKGSDSAIIQLCQDLGLDASLKALYRSDTGESDFCLMDYFVNLDVGEIEGNLSIYLEENHEAQRGWSLGEDDGEDNRGKVCVAWVKPLTNLNPFRTSYLHYGNEASMLAAYGEICIVADVDRETSVQEESDDSDSE